MMKRLILVVALVGLVRAGSDEVDVVPSETPNETPAELEIPPVGDENYAVPEEPIYETPSGGGMDRYENKDILLVSWVPYPIDKWDYTLLNISDPGYVRESGRAEMNSFSRERYPDVAIILACAPRDRDYFYNYNMDVPIIGVDPFQNDKIFLEYLDRIYTIHGFQNPTELWAHFVSHQEAFLPVIGRLSQEFQQYLEQWTPRPYDNYYYGAPDRKAALTRGIGK